MWQSGRLQRHLSPPDWCAPVGPNPTASAISRAGVNIPCRPLFSHNILVPALVRSRPCDIRAWLSGGVVSRDSESCDIFAAGGAPACTDQIVEESDQVGVRPSGWSVTKSGRRVTNLVGGHRAFKHLAPPRKPLATSPEARSRLPSPHRPGPGGWARPDVSCGSVWPESAGRAAHGGRTCDA